uniref:Uncharacterized protein n=1 Tax=Strigamia maritima TaxID=126957 RepID=T1JED4_STRMM
MADKNSIEHQRECRFAKKRGKKHHRKITNTPITTYNPLLTEPDSSYVRKHQITPVGFRGIPTLVREIWPALRHVGKRSFEPYDNQQHCQTVIKIMLYLCRAKIAFAHRNSPPCSHLTQCLFNVETDILAQIGSRLPHPLAVALDCFGYFRLDDEVIVPIIDDRVESGISTFSPRKLGEHLQMLNSTWRPRQELRSGLLENIRKLDPEFKWEEQNPPEIGQAMSASLRPCRVPSTFVAQWGFPEKPSTADIQAFLNVMQTQYEVSDWVVHCDIRSGKGSPAQIVQFRDKEMDDRDGGVRLYSVVKVTPYDFACAAAVRPGDTDSPPATRYTVGNYDTALQVATYYCGSCRQKLMNFPSLRRGVSSRSVATSYSSGSRDDV